MESWKLAFLLGLGCQVPMAAAQVKAFEEAEGFGAFAKGARTDLANASVYRVTNLNDSGAGSFRDAVSAANRFVVFDVGGIVNLSSTLVVKNNVTIAGQTAPGGISLYGQKVSFSGANNTIARHFAIRKGQAGVRDDASGASNGANMMFDHMSITWGVDETFSLNSDGKGTSLDNITIQKSIIAQGLDRLGHSAGGLMTLPEGARFSIIKSLFADNVTRNPKVRGENEFINNVVYGYENAGYIMGDFGSDNTTYDAHANAEGNYFIHGVATRFDHLGNQVNINPGAPFASGSSRFHIYGRDNWLDGDRDGTLDGSLITNYPGADVVGTRFAFPTAASMTAQEAVAYVMKNAGLSIVRDAVDARLMQEVASYGTLGSVILRETDLFPGYGTDAKYLNPRARLVDTDNDGMPDNWEASRGLNPNLNATSEWRALNAAGYTRLEEYLNELGADGETILSSGGDWANAATWNGSAPTIADSAVVVGNLNVGGGNAFARRIAVGGNLSITGGTLDVFDTAQVDGTLSITGGTATLGRVLLSSVGTNGALTLSAGSTLQTGPIAGGGGNALLTFDGGTYRALGAPNVSVATVINAAGGTIDATSYSGTHSGRITGAGKLTKLGTGTLTLSGNNAFAGGIDLTGNLKLAHSNAAGTGAITIATAGGQVQLGHGVTVSNAIFSNNTFESLDVPDAGATATFAGNLTRVSNQVRIRASGAGSTLNLTGATNAGSQIFILSTGNVFLKGSGSITSGTGAIGRGGTVTNFTAQDNAAVNIGASSMGGGQAATSTTINVLGNATFSTGAANFDLLSTTSATSASELNLDGGTTTVNGFTKSSVGATQTSKLNFNGGTLRYGGGAAGNASFLPALAGLTASVEAGGARIDDNGRAITVAAPLVHQAGLATVDGGLTKLGAGTLTLAATNTYNGATNVNAGRLLVNGALVGAVNVAANATLGGGGSIAGVVSIANNGTLSPGNSPGILNVGGVALSAGADLAIELNGTAAGTAYDQLNVTGGVSLDGADLLATLGYVPAAGDSLFIVKNDATDAVAGQFSGLADGSTLSLTSSADGQSYAFAISYFGDAEQGLASGGNDVVLTRLTAVPEPAALATLGLAVATGLRRRRRIVSMS